MVMDIVQASSEQLWDSEELTPWDCIVALTAAALEAQDPNMSGIQFSPHFILHGSAGKGKTLLEQLLFPPDIASVMTNDSQGVGQMALRFKHKVLKIDDAGPAFFNNTALTAAVKLCIITIGALKRMGIGKITRLQWHSLQQIWMIQLYEQPD